MAIFDILTKPEPKLSSEEIKEVKKVSSKLYANIKEIIEVLDWRKKQEKKAEIKVSIKTILNDGLLIVYDKPIFDQKRIMIYDYIYETM